LSIELYTISLVFIFVSALCFVFYMYHKAHGRDVDAVRSGGELVMEAMRRNGQITGADADLEIVKAFNYDDDPEEEVKQQTNHMNEVVERLEKRSQMLADQMAEKGISEVMEKMNEKI